MTKSYLKPNNLHDVMMKIFNDIEVLPLALMLYSRSQ